MDSAGSSNIASSTSSSAPPPPAPLCTPAPHFIPITGLECRCSVDGERFPGRVLQLPSECSSARPLQLPFTSLWTSSTSFSSPTFSLHLHLDLPSASSSPLGCAFRVELSSLYVNARWREEEAERELHPLRHLDAAVQDIQPILLAQRLGHTAQLSRTGKLRLQALTIDVSPATEPREANFSEVRLQWLREGRGGESGGVSVYALSLRPVLLRGAEWNGVAGEQSVGELHWSELGRVRRGVKRPLDDDEEKAAGDHAAAVGRASSTSSDRLRWVEREDDDVDAPELRPTLLSPPRDAADGVAASHLSSSSDSDDEPQLASTAPSAPLSFPFLSDCDYAASVRLESVLLFHYREWSVFSRGHEWIQCEACNAYRRLPEWAVMDELPAVWVCRMNPNMLMDDCSRKSEEEEMGRRGDWVDDYCACCEQPQHQLVSGFGGWQRVHTTSTPNTHTHPATSSTASSSSAAPAVLTNTTASPSSSSSSASSSSPTSSSAAAAGSVGFPLCSVPPVQQGSPLIGCSGPCCRSFHVDCAGLKGTFPSATHRQVDREYYCSDCTHGRGVCFMCGLRGTEGMELRRCGAVCGKLYHISCMPPLSSYHRSIRRRLREAASKEAKERAAAASARRKKARKAGEGQPKRRRRRSRAKANADEEDDSDGDEDDGDESASSELDVSAFVCPRHWCSACGESGEDRVLMRCIRCPVAYHCSAPCRPVHVQLITERAFICSRHGDAEEEKEGKARRRSATVSLSTSSPPRQWRFPQWISRAERREAELGLAMPPSSDGHYQLSPLALRLFPAVLRYHYPSLPLRVSPSLLLLSLGRVVSDRPAFHLDWTVFPVGYKALRTVAMQRAAAQGEGTEAAAVSITILCEIVDGGPAPLFRVTPVFLTRPTAQQANGAGGGSASSSLSSSSSTEDVRLNKRRDEGVLDRLIDHVWTKVERSWAAWTRHRYEAAQFPIPQDVPAAFHSLRSAAGLLGCSRFGLLHDAVAQLIQRLPQTADCAKYHPPAPQQPLVPAAAAEAAVTPPQPRHRAHSRTPPVASHTATQQAQQRAHRGQRDHETEGKRAPPSAAQPQPSTRTSTSSSSISAAVRPPSALTASPVRSQWGANGEREEEASGGDAPAMTHQTTAALSAPTPSTLHPPLSVISLQMEEESKAAPPAAAARLAGTDQAERARGVELPASTSASAAAPSSIARGQSRGMEEEKAAGAGRLHSNAAAWSLEQE